jgi:TRAP-type transport system periplasmic protein
MRKIVLIGTVALAIFSFFVFLPSESTAKPIALSFSTFFPATHIQAKTSEAWCKEVEERTEGRVKIQFYPGQTLTRANQTYDAIMDGIADIGTAALAYTQDRFPVMAAMDLPFGYPSGVAATKVANKLFEKMNPDEFSGSKVLFFHAHGPGLIHTGKKPVKSLEDLRGLRIRSTGQSAQVIKALGGTPVSMPMPDSYQSLQRGVVDGSIHPVETNKGWNIGEVVSYVTPSNASAYTTAFFVTMSKRKWDSISAKDQAIIEELNQKYAIKHGEAWDSSDVEGIEFFKQKGGQVISLSKEEEARWATAVAPLFEDYIKHLNAKGVDGKAVIDFIKTELDALR